MYSIPMINAMVYDLDGNALGIVDHITDGKDGVTIYVLTGEEDPKVKDNVEHLPFGRDKT